jgi:hypothetical protein
MMKRVKLAEDSNVFGMDEVAEFDNLSLDGSQGEVTTLDRRMHPTTKTIRSVPRSGFILEGIGV